MSRNNKIKQAPIYKTFTTKKSTYTVSFRKSDGEKDFWVEDEHYDCEHVYVIKAKSEGGVTFRTVVTEKSPNGIDIIKYSQKCFSHKDTTLWGMEEDGKTPLTLSLRYAVNKNECFIFNVPLYPQTRAEREYQSLLSSHIDLLRDNEELDDEIWELKDEINLLKYYNHDDISEFDGIVEDIEEEKNDLADELQNLRDDYADLKEQHAELRYKYEKLASEDAEFIKDVREYRFDEMLNAKCNYRDQVKDYENRIAKQQKQIDELQKKLKVSENTITNAQRDYNNLYESYHRVLRAADLKEAELARADQPTIVYCSECNRATETCENIKEYCNNLSEEHEELKKQFAQLKETMGEDEEDDDDEDDDDEVL